MFTAQPLARFQFGGPVGQRIDANVDHWLLRAPSFNPGMLEMFRLRDRQPAPNLVPWAGEFVGKYLISAIQALRMSDRPELRHTVRNVVAELIATQADDGYLGPFPKAIRLKANWDLWGHYHCMLALLMWHEATDDDAALTACRRAADLVCRTFLGTHQRIFDAGSHEMNMAIIHGLGWLYRVTGEPRYRQMMREIEKDWERAGDYLRAGLAEKEFFQTPRPRWESLHDLQGLVELYRITGEAKYREAFEHHWRSIRRWDQRNTGGFSSGEQATGNPYAPTAIETCCTIAWMALSVDMLSLTGDPLVADDLELATFNAWAGAQHPSGNWCTYSTPMDGTREASAQAIVFQARAGTPELNCCSVNGPRGWGMLSEWAVMSMPDGLVVNYYGPGAFEGTLLDSTPIKLRWETDYPFSDRIRLTVEPAQPRPFTLKLRIPAWTRNATAQVNSVAVPGISSGAYLTLNRRWQRGDVATLEFPMVLRAVAGDREQRGKVSLYRGPLLLAYDQRFNAFDEAAIPPVDWDRFNQGQVVPSDENNPVLRPWLLVELRASDGRQLRLCDFASAGAAGTRYRSWLQATHAPPPPPVTRSPADGATVPSGPALFRWSGAGGHDTTYRLAIADAPGFLRPTIEIDRITSNRVVLTEVQTRQLPSGQWQFWQVIARNAHGETPSVLPAARFRVDQALPPLSPDSLVPHLGPGALLVADSLSGQPKPSFGKVLKAEGFKAASGPDTQPNRAVELDGQAGRVTYAVEEFPEEDYSMAIWARLTQLPEGHLGQISSAWAGPMDDPLRVCVEKGRLFARIEAGRGFSTDGIPVEVGRWHHIAAVKEGTRLTLFVDGESKVRAEVPALVHSAARDLALGGNPHYSGNEFLAVQLADFAFYARAVPAKEIGELARPKK